MFNPTGSVTLTPPESVKTKAEYFHWLHSCASKAVHKTPEEALEHLKRLGKHTNKPARKLQAYECRFATAEEPHFHVGHKPKRTGKRDKCQTIATTTSAMQFMK